MAQPNKAFQDELVQMIRKKKDQIQRSLDALTVTDSRFPQVQKTLATLQHMEIDAMVMCCDLDQSCP